MSAAYIFDVEGTLIDCVPDILRCWSETLTAHGIAVPSAHLQRLSGMDGNEMLTTLVPGLDGRARKKILTGQASVIARSICRKCGHFPACARLSSRSSRAADASRWPPIAKTTN
jgi:beta-phosphoglucomutase-like phosphatase (HAD superfamily)